MLNKMKDFQVLLLGLLLFLGLIISVKIATDTLSSNSITVTGSAFKLVKSDEASWKIDLNATGKTQAVAYATIKKQLPLVDEYLTKNGIAKKDIEVLTPNFYPTYGTNPKTGYPNSEIVGYNYTQSISVNSPDVDKIKELSIGIQSLLNNGVNLTSNAPEYNYSKLPDLKVELLEQATIDAKTRAKSMLKANNNRVGSIKSVKMGVFQITPPTSNSVADWGISDTTTIDKKVSAVANVVFRVK